MRDPSAEYRLVMAMGGVVDARLVDVTQDALRRRRLRVRRLVLLYVAVPMSWLAAALSYAAVGRRLAIGAGFALEILAASSVVFMLVLAARPGRDPTFSAWRTRTVGARRRGLLIMVAIFIPIWTVVATTILTLAGPGGVLVFGALFIPFWLILAPLLPVMSRMWVRLETVAAKDAMAWDGRAPVVYLRSFAFDGANLSGSVFRYSFEEALAQRLWLHGPVVAAARPRRGMWAKSREVTDGGKRPWDDRSEHARGVSLPVNREGASRAWLSQDWQRTVSQWLADARLIVLVLGDTEGLAWEIAQISQRGLQARVIVLIPPGRKLPQENTRSGNDSQWLRLRYWLMTPPAGAVLPPAIEPASTLAIIPGVGKPPTVIVSRSQRREDYESAIDAAATAITAHHQGPSLTAASVRPTASPALGPPPQAAQQDHQRRRDLPSRASTGGHVLDPGNQRLSWPGSQAVQGGPKWHLSFLLTLFFLNGFSVVLPLVAYHQIKAAHADNTSQGRRALIWCRVYGGLALAAWVLPFVLLE
jgi:hypothetical protein